MRYGNRAKDMQAIIDRAEKPEYRIYTRGIRDFGSPKRNTFERTVRQSPPQDSDASYLNERWLYMYGMPNELIVRSKGDAGEEAITTISRDDFIENVSRRLDLTSSEEEALKSETGRDVLDTLDNLSSLEGQNDLFKEINQPKNEYQRNGLIGHNTFMEFDEAAVRVKNIAAPSKATANDTGDPDYSLAFLKQEIDSEGNVIIEPDIQTVQVKAKGIRESYNRGTKDALEILQKDNPQNELQALRVIDRVSTFGEDWAYKEGARAVKTTIRRAAREARDRPIYDAVDAELNTLTENGRRMAILR